MKWQIWLRILVLPAQHDCWDKAGTAQSKPWMFWRGSTRLRLVSFKGGSSAKRKLCRESEIKYPFCSKAAARLGCATL
jgi:hypothetical protein